MSSASKPAPSKRVLLAEEQRGSRDLIMLVLSKLGYNVVPAHNFNSTLELLGRQGCACVLLSSSLPDGGGAEAVSRIRASCKGRPRPVVLVLGNEDEKLRTACLAAGAQAYLLRPVEIERLLRLLKHSVAAPALEPQPVEAPAEPVIDLEHLCGFTDGDRQLERELAALYLSSAEVYLQRMRAALDKGDRWQATAHALKGASSNLGARRVASLALAAESSDASEALLVALFEAVDDVRRFFDGRQPCA